MTMEQEYSPLDRWPQAQGRDVQAFSLYPGVELFYLHLEGESPALGHPPLEQVLQITYCRSGQAVWRMGDGNQIYLNPGNFSLHAMGGCTGACLTLPEGSYQGLSLWIDLNRASETITELLGGLDILRSPFLSSFRQRGAAVFLAGNEGTEAIFSGFYGQPEHLQRAYRRLKVLELLLCLSGMELTAQPQLRAYQAEQIEIVREIHRQLLSHMERRITIEELARQYLINPTTLKAAFKSVYGTSLAAHIKEHRMEHAAQLLKETDLSIAEIAQAVGYDSQSKFSAAFKGFFQVLPREYRRRGEYHAKGGCGI